MFLFRMLCFQMARHTCFSIPMSRQLATSEINKMKSKKLHTAFIIETNRRCSAMEIIQYIRKNLPAVHFHAEKRLSISEVCIKMHHLLYTTGNEKSSS